MSTPSFHGSPCWYELGTSDLPAARAFYADTLGWSVADSGMESMAYDLATAPGGGLVAGLSSNLEQPGPPPPNWLVYFACDDVDALTAAMTADGAHLLVPASDIPGTGRIAICADPTGAVFGLLQPAPMEAEPTSYAFDQNRPGHGHWHELMSSDPDAALAFYSKHLGWTTGEALDMGEMGAYQLVQDKGREIGAIMGLGDAPASAWLPYFGTTGVDEAIARIQAGGGAIHVGPMEVPGGAFIAVATDPQGAWFAVLGPKSAA